MNLPINVGVASRAGHEMETSIFVQAYVGTFRDFGVHAAGTTSVTRFRDPYPGKVGVKDSDQTICDPFEFFLQSSRTKQILSQGAEFLNPPRLNS